MRYYLSILLKSDATFGRGDSTPGVVDLEIEHDEYGCPFIGGRALKGLLLEECVNLRFALGEDAWMAHWDAAAVALFGRSGATSEGAALLHIDRATLPPALLEVLRQDVRAGTLTREQVLDALTAIRRQTSVSAATGAPESSSLRAMRVLLRDTPLVAPLDFEEPPAQQPLGLLAACVLAVRRGGTGRNRGRGRLAMLLHDTLPSRFDNAAFTTASFAVFSREVE